LRLRLGFRKPKLAPYNLKMVDQITTKPMGLFRNLKIYVHGIPYITTFTVLHNSVVDSSYSMFLGRPWLRDAKLAHAREWDNLNNYSYQTFGKWSKKTISVTMLWLLKWHHRRRKIIIFVIEPKLFSIGTIILPKAIQSMKTTDVGIMDTDVKTTISE
jgi:hypothetical protein